MGHRKTNTITQKFTSFLKDAVKAPPAPPPDPEPEEPELPPLTTHTDEWEETVVEEDTRAQAEAPDVLDELNSATKRWKETGDPGLHLKAPVAFSERAKQVWNKIAHDVSPKVAHALKNKIETVAQTANTKLHQIHRPQFTQTQRTPNTPASTPPTPPIPQETTIVQPAPQTTQPQPTTQTPLTPKQPTPTPAPTSPEQVDSAIIASWMEVLKKAEENSTPTEREEIEKLYKQLSQ